MARLRRALPRMFAFCEHVGVKPTNGVAERALRHGVVRRKTGGQLKWGAVSAERMSTTPACLFTWRATGKRGP